MADMSQSVWHQVTGSSGLSWTALRTVYSPKSTPVLAQAELEVGAAASTERPAPAALKVRS